MIVGNLNHYFLRAHSFLGENLHYLIYPVCIIPLLVNDFINSMDFFLYPKGTRHLWFIDKYF